MIAKPLVDEMLSSPGDAPAIALVDADAPIDNPEISIDIGAAGSLRRFSVYAPSAAFDLADELDFLTRRAIDHNVFFAPQFLIPAMPRLDERQVRLMVMRDVGPRRSRLRLLMPYSVERTGFIGGASVIRVWTHPFGPLGTPLVDSDDPRGTLESLLKAVARPELSLPNILVLPDLRIDGPMATTLTAAARSLGLSVAVANATDRAALVKDPGGTTTAMDALSSRRRREVRRQARLLEARGAVSFEVARDPLAVRMAMEEFLILEASGWKGRERSALIMDRYRAAFARESVNKLAEKDRTRIFTLRVAGQAVASLVAFIDGGEAFAWKMAYDEDHSAASPGLQMLLRASQAMIEDPAIARVDSCTVPDHFLMNRIWKDRLAISTLVIGLKSGMGPEVQRVATSLEKTRRSRNLARIMRQRLKGMMGM